MAFSHGTKAKFYFNLIDLSPYIEDVSPEFTRALDSIKPLANTYDNKVAGHRDVSISVAGVYDPDTIDAQIWDAFDDGEDHVWVYAPAGDTIGACCYCGKARSGSIQIPVTDGALRYPAGAVGSENADRCQILHVLSEESDDGTDTSQDGGAQSSNGIIAYILCTAIEDGATLDVTIQDSADDDTFGTLGSFTQITAAGDEVLEVSGTVERYVRVSWDLSEVAGDDATFFVAFRRL